MWIKICANTSLDDAQRAADLGADAVGFVFAPSSRQVTAAEVAAISQRLPPRVERIGVFPALPAAKIEALAIEAGLTGVQLHGGFDLALARALHGAFRGTVKIIQTLHWLMDPAEEEGSPDARRGKDSEAGRIAAELARIAAEPAIDRVLIDSKRGKLSGGTGIPFDWNAAQGLFSCGNDSPSETAVRRKIVAGGLTPENVAEAIAQLNPWGVDVASGVESSPGRKDPQKLREFLENARGAGRPS